MIPVNSVFAPIGNNVASPSDDTAKCDPNEAFENLVIQGIPQQLSFTKVAAFGWEGTAGVSTPNEPDSLIKYEQASVGSPYYIWKMSTGANWYQDGFEIPEGVDPVANYEYDLPNFNSSADVQWFNQIDENGNVSMTAQGGLEFGYNNNMTDDWQYWNYTQMDIDYISEMSDQNQTTGQWESGRRAIIAKLSDFLWFSLDAWGRLNVDSEQPQCNSVGDCFGGSPNNFDSQKCCASISLQRNP